MHLIDKDPVPKKDSLGTAIKNKITKKVGSIIASPYVKYKESQMRASDKEYNFLKDYNAKAKSGIGNSEKDQAIFKSIRDRK